MKEEIIILIGRTVKLRGLLTVPAGSRCLVIFSHGRGSSRLSPRKNFVAEMLNQKQFSTLLTDLLTEEEDLSYENRFDIDLLTNRLVEVTKAVRQFPEVKGFPIGYFGASTGAASALKAAAKQAAIRAVVSRGGRPDLAGESLNLVTSPTLLIVGGNDEEVIELNRKACHLLHCEKKMKIIKGATHLFEEPGKLEEVANLACEWFTKHLPEIKPEVVTG